MNLLPEDQKHFEELRFKQIETQKLIVQVSSQLTAKERIKRKSELTLEEIRGLASSTKLYQAVGRAFILTDNQVVAQNLEATAKEADGEVTNLLAQKAYIEKQAEEADNAVQEFLKSK